MNDLKDGNTKRNKDDMLRQTSELQESVYVQFKKSEDASEMLALAQAYRHLTEAYETASKLRPNRT